MPTTIEQFDTTQQSLAAVLDAAPADAWDNPSPCEGWSARDVLSHLVHTQRDFLTGRGLDIGPAPDLGGDPVTAWSKHAGRVRSVVADASVMATEYDGHFGRTTIGDTIARFYIFDMVVHRWDIARATGVDARLTEAELDRIEDGAESFGEALYMDGVCRPGVEAPEGADRTTRVLARLGRAS